MVFDNNMFRLMIVWMLLNNNDMFRLVVTKSIFPNDNFCTRRLEFDKDNNDETTDQKSNNYSNNTS